LRRPSNNVLHDNHTMTEEEFTPHEMFSKEGKAVMAKTYKQHLILKEKGYGHSPPKSAGKKKTKNQTSSNESFTDAVERRTSGGY